ncbi:uncharacterized protein N7482_005040 [Penicillium canariense]|uniref:Uncharacterized protein n=1 Tax=Penicillium canariense TaxID=189055 RepID=A0A9W9I1N0_9EURO|nr:uncharacterized protein N7482_005040 [Penicillium canariense]KAJ5166259.1 hypothetical protein N7482_005040 [Penicillium canariense]
MKEARTATLSSEKLEARSYAIISLGIMCLVALLTHILLSPPLNPPSSPGEEMNAMVLRGLGSSVLFFVWAVGLAAWGKNLAEFSIHKRNQSFIFGLVAGNVSLAYLILTKPHAPAQEYITYTLWPAHVALAIGVLF